MAEFFVVYIREAHAADSRFPAPVPGGETINTPKTFAQRVAIADMCVTSLKLDMPCLVDDMDNSTESAYSAWPDRLFVVGADGRIAVRANRGPWGFKPAVREATEWLRKEFPNRADSRSP